MPTRPRALAAVVILSSLACGINRPVVGVHWDGGGPEAGDSDTLSPFPGPFVSGTLSVLAGAISGRGSADGTGPAARFMLPAGVALDPDGNVLVADTGNHTIRRITPARIVTTLAGAPGVQGSVNGPVADARFNGPFGVAVDSHGNIFVADTSNHTIRRISAGNVITWAGAPGVADAANGPGDMARFNLPLGLVVDGADTVLVADSRNNTIRKITPDRMVSTLAGSAGQAGTANGTGTAARFNYPTSVAVDSSGNILVGDSTNNAIRRIAKVTTEVTTFVSGGLSGPSGMAVDDKDSVFLADYGKHVIRKITPLATVTTFAGAEGLPGSTDGTGGGARFSNPSGVALDRAGNLFVADFANDTIRMITRGQVVSTLAGTAGATGAVDGIRTVARFSTPAGMAVDGTGNIFVADPGSNTIRKITPVGVVSTVQTPAGSFSQPQAVAVDRAGNLFVADSDNHTISSITPDGAVTLLAGAAGNRGSTNGDGGDARFNGPTGVAVDQNGNVFVADTGNHTIRRITQGTVSTFAGTPGQPGNANGIGGDARFAEPQGVAVDAHGNVFVADTGNHAIRKIASDGSTTTLPDATVAPCGPEGTGVPCFNHPTGVAVDREGNILVADRDNNAVRKVGSDGAVSIVAGAAASTTGGTVPGPLPASLDRPQAVAIDPSTGSIYITVEGAVLVVTF